MGDTFVGGLSLLFGFVAAGIAAGPWDPPYRLRSIEAIQRRFGRAAARLAWLVLALTCFASAISILSGIRPSYAAPSGEPTVADRY